jgi:hypothetical protein
MYSNNDNSYGDRPEGPRISPIYERLMVSLAKAELIIHTRANDWNRLERHLDHVQAARSLVKEAAIHDASELPGRAKANLGQAINRLKTVVTTPYNDNELDENKFPDYDSKEFNDHVSNFVETAAKHLKKLPDEEDW